MKKILIISVVVFVIALSAFIVQKVFFDVDQEVVDEQSVEQKQEILEQEKKEQVDQENSKWEEKIVKLSDQEIKGATVAKGGSQILYYQDQRFMTMDFNGGTKTSVGAYPFVNVQSIEWNVKKEKAIIKDSGKYYLYVLGEKTPQELSDDVDIAVWSTQPEKILLKYYNSQIEDRVFAIVGTDNLNDKRVIRDELPYKFIDIVAVSKKNHACYFPVPNATIKDVLMCFDTRTMDVALKYEGNFGADYLWSNDGGRLLISYLQEINSGRLLLGATNDQGSEFKGLNFPTTVKKCVWSDDNVHVYCAMIGNDTEETQAPKTLPDDWEKGKFSSVDTFWKINTLDGKKERLIEVEQLPNPIDATGFFVEASERYLFFTDRKAGQLYRLAIRQ